MHKQLLNKIVIKIIKNNTNIFHIISNFTMEFCETLIFFKDQQ